MYIERQNSADTTDDGAPPDTLYVVEDDDDLREALCELFRPTGYRFQGYGSAEAFLQDFCYNGPACLIVDERLPGMNGSDLLRRLHCDGIRTPAVLVTAFASTPVTVDAMQHGAVTVLEKPCSHDKLQDIVRQAIEADTARLRKEEPAREARKRLSQLSTSERDVLRMVLDGIPNKQIAGRLGVCIRTVESRRSKIYQATKVGSVAELVRMCLSAGWDAPITQDCHSVDS